MNGVFPKRISVPRFPQLAFSKRTRFVISSLVLTAGLTCVFVIGPQWGRSLTFLLAGLSALLTTFSLRDELTSIYKWIVLVILPSMFILGIGLFYFLLPDRWLTRLIFLAFFAVCEYALLLTENIYVVSAIRNIKLLHAAHTIGFLLSVICAFGLYHVIYAFHFPFFVVAPMVFLTTGLLGLPILWSIKLTDKGEKEDLLYVGVLALLIAQIGTIITFWPITATFSAIFLAGNFYTFLGLIQNWLEERLFQRVLWEYIWVAGILFVILFVTTKWGV